MASIFSHALVAFAITQNHPKPVNFTRMAILAMVCAMIPDADVISFNLGIPYEHVLGHRGITHSLLFALIFGLGVTAVFFRKIKLLSKEGIGLTLLFFLSTASHGVLDAMTSGGLGVAFFAPFENSRYFFPWRPIQVSPIGAENFFSEWGLRVIKSEAIWVGIPSAVLIFLGWGIKKLSRKKPN